MWWDLRWHLKLYGGTIFNGSINWIPCCRRAVAEGAQTEISGQVWYPEKFLGWKMESPWWMVNFEEIIRLKWVQMLRPKWGPLTNCLKMLIIFLLKNDQDSVYFHCDISARLYNYCCTQHIQCFDMPQNVGSKNCREGCAAASLMWHSTVYIWYLTTNQLSSIH